MEKLLSKEEIENIRTWFAYANQGTVPKDRGQLCDQALACLELAEWIKEKDKALEWVMTHQGEIPTVQVANAALLGRRIPIAERLVDVSV